MRSGHLVGMMTAAEESPLPLSLNALSGQRRRVSQPFLQALKLLFFACVLILAIVSLRLAWVKQPEGERLVPHAERVFAPEQYVPLEPWVPALKAVETLEEAAARLTALKIKGNESFAVRFPGVRRERCLDGYETPSPERHQRCCRLKGLLVCLPNLVIIGAQKGGSTALHSYLLFHPNLAPGNKKELHMFDMDRNFFAIEERLSSLLPGLPFADRNTTESRDLKNLTRNRIWLDSSPSYVADHQSCPRMARVLSADARFIMLLRDPVERLWSEVQMKQRRIDVQAEFLEDILPPHHARVYECAKRWFPRSEGMTSGLSMSSGSTNDSSASSSVIITPYVQFRQCVPNEVSRHSRFTQFARFVIGRSYQASRFINDCLRISPQAVIDCSRNPDYAGRIFTEKMPDAINVIYEEATRIRDVMSRGCCEPNSTTIETTGMDSQPSSDQADEGSALYNRPVTFTHGATTRKNIRVECRGCGCQCFPKASMMSDISKNYIWRSMYLPHLIHCFQHISRERVLILNMEDLRTSPAVTLSKVFRHAGVPDVDMRNVTYDQARKLFSLHYPDFEHVSGWTHTSERTALQMPNEFRIFLTEFFRPFNKELFGFLEIEPFEGWAV